MDAFGMEIGSVNVLDCGNNNAKYFLNLHMLDAPNMTFMRDK